MSAMALFILMTEQASFHTSPLPWKLSSYRCDSVFDAIHGHLSSGTTSDLVQRSRWWRASYSWQQAGIDTWQSDGDKKLAHKWFTEGCSICRERGSCDEFKPLAPLHWPSITGE